MEYDQKTGIPIPISDIEALKNIRDKVEGLINRKYSKGFVYDILEEIIKEHAETAPFECSKENFEKSIFAVGDAESTLTLFIGPYPKYRKTCLSNLCQRVSNIIYEINRKDEILEIMFAFLLREMKLRFSKRGCGYTYSGIEGIREEGIIKKK